MTLLSVVVPTLNESEHLSRTLARLQDESGLSEVELLVVDGGSSDGTRALARGRAHLLRSAPGRARQLNEGGRRARGELLFFCHADSVPAAGFGKAIAHSLEDPRLVAGAFTPHYVPAHPLLNLASWLLRLPSPYLVFGDSGLFLRRHTFLQVEGFPLVSFMEDVAMIKELRGLGRIVRLPVPIVTSSRRFFERGVLRQLWLDIHLLLAHHLLGHELDLLAGRYHITSRDSSASHGS